MTDCPNVLQCFIYPRNKTVPPYPATIVVAPTEAPPDITPEPPLVIWGPGDPRPNPPIYLPPEGPPDTAPPSVEPPHEGWNWSAAKSQWYYLYVPGSGDAQPKKK